MAFMSNEMRYSLGQMAEQMHLNIRLRQCWWPTLVVVCLWGLAWIGRATSPEVLGSGLGARTEGRISEKPVEKPVTAPELKPDPADARIAYVAARLLEGQHYTRQRLDDEVSSRFLDRYVESYDPQRLHFLQSDLREFEFYRHRLDDYILRRFDTTPAFEIFQRFFERLQQRVKYVEELLQTEDFRFDTDERIQIDRRKAPYPKDLAEAKKLWRDRLRYEYLQEKLNGEKPQQITNTLLRRYQRNLRMFSEWDNADVMQVFLNALAHVYDPHSDYLGRQQMENFAMGMNLALEGIGAELTSPDGYCTIRRLIPGGPADRSKKLRPKDRIIGVAQGDGPFVDVVDMNLNKVVQLIRGPKGTTVRLLVIPADAADPSERREVTLVRDRIRLEDQAAKAKVVDWPDERGTVRRIGIIDLPSFYSTMDFTGSEDRSDFRSCAADVARLVTKLKAEGMEGLILDLRRNGGGSLDEAIRITGFFIPRGPVVQVRDGEGRVVVKEDRDPRMLWEGPMVVLVSRFSASASEIVAAALQDYGRAVLVGDVSTHGKGTVQAPSLLRNFMRPSATLTQDPGLLKYTVSKFYRANGESTQLKGVVPDIVLPSVLNVSKDIGESALDNPLPWDTIESAKYEKLDWVAPYLDELRKRSAGRVAASPDFAHVQEDIARFLKTQEDRSISLNEQLRLKEKEELETRRKAREKERLSRRLPEVPVRELTLADVDKPGLPAPITRLQQAGGTATTEGAPSGPAAETASATDRDPGVRAPNEAAVTEPTEENLLENDEGSLASNDFVLREAEMILLDYLHLWNREKALTARKDANAGTEANP
ncbi:MAG: carboxy terminal-processing peptidase [Verrucomicrobiota bacterium]|nr:carboxy terminal-processing peptidase [Limisphaera sp.]MDW8381814.1 carboxy terminal-processing peptidase [Verrucomicrobiota bacterium]